MTSGTNKVDIRPEVGILSVLRHLNYKPWFALAEFVDNSLQSYLQNRTKLEQVDNGQFKLKVSITLDRDGGQIIARDNAAGISEADYPRAFRPAALPPDRTGLAEFGMGMKSAACWFSKRWSVRTSALGEPIERIVRLDIGTIVRDSLQELKVESSPCRDRDHFTEIVLSDLNSIPQTQTIAKIKRHLTSIYRVFIREGILELCLNDELLEYSEPGVLCVSYHKTPAGDPCDWRKEIDFDFGQGLKAKGFAALLTTGSTSGAGFALFRRKRLIQGSGDETYRPEQIFGKPNSYRYQRLFGELQLEGFDVSHTKDGFRWDGNEETFLELLREHLDAEPLPLLDQAENWRSRRKPSDWREGAIAASRYEHYREFLEEIIARPPRY